MKKRIIILILFVIILMISSVFVGIFVYKNYKKSEQNENGMYNVPVSSWDDTHSRYIICEIENKNISINYTEAYAIFESQLTLEELAAQNDDFIEQIEYYYGNLKYDANLYFANNNYYVLSYVPESENEDAYYTAESLSCVIQPYTDIAKAYAPLPMYIVLSQEVLDMYKEKNRNYLDYFFNVFTFEETCKFYERYTNDTAEIDYGNKLIYVNAREIGANGKGIMKNYLCIDFSNRRFICDKGGENEVVFE